MVLAYLADIPGMSRGAWRHPEVDPTDVVSVDAYKRLARTAERGKFDLFFKADVLGAYTDNLESWTEWPHYHASKPDPLTLVAAISGATDHIGLGVTVSSSFAHPFDVARSFATLDHITGGRIAWNIVTSAARHVSQNYGQDELLPHDVRYEVARESYEIATSYWDTWEDDAFTWDKENARSFEPSKFHATHYEGTHFKVSGGLPIPRSPQGYPVIIQAGASEAGQEFAAETAEIVFGTGTSLEVAQKFYGDLKGRMARFGRDRDDLKIISGLEVIVGETEAEAQRKREVLDGLITMRARLRYLSDDLEVDLQGLPLDKPIPAELVPTTANFHQQYFDEIQGLIAQGLTLGEVARRYNRSRTAIVGTPVQVADHLQTWFESGASDGFMLSGMWNPGNLEDFVDLVIPELQRRGIARTEYAGRTLRENLGFVRPDNRHVAATQLAPTAAG